MKMTGYRFFVFTVFGLLNLFFSSFFFGCSQDLDYNSPTGTLNIIGRFYQLYNRRYNKNFENFWFNGKLHKNSGSHGGYYWAQDELVDLFFKGNFQTVKNAMESLDQYEDYEYKIEPEILLFKSAYELNYLSKTSDPENELKIYSVDLKTRKKSLLNSESDPYALSFRAILACGSRFPEDDEYRKRVSTVHIYPICKIVSFSEIKNFKGLCKLAYSRTGLGHTGSRHVNNLVRGYISSIALVPFGVDSGKACESKASKLYHQGGTSQDIEIREYGPLAVKVRVFEMNFVDWTYLDSSLNPVEMGEQRY